MKNKTVMQHAFSRVPNIKKPRSVFDRSHGYKTTFDTDYLIPFYFANVLPGDSVSVKHSALVRLLSPLIKPFMDNLYFDWFYFFVPYRLVWTNFVKFMGEQDNPTDSISYTVPQCTGPNVAAGGIPIHSLQDYFGIPTGPLSGGGGTTGITYNNLLPRSYNLIYNQWFRDQNLELSVVVDKDDGPDTFADYDLLKRAKRYDYFTSCLPNLQKGTAVTLPLGTSATVMTSATELVSGAQSAMGLRMIDGTALPGGRGLMTGSGDIAVSTVNDAGAVDQRLYPDNLYADLSAATAASINTIRQAVALQQFLENDARGGTRYTEIVNHRWGVTSPDARLQRAELLALGSAPIRIHPVASTADTGNGAYNDTVGALGGFGTGGDVGNGFSKAFTEHGCIIGLINVRADLTYQQGLDRFWSYRTRYDFFNPEFAHLGEQAVLNKEIFANVPDGTSSVQKDGVFGYQERYAEERYNKSLITGKLRSDASGTLEVWHLSQDFASLPTLGPTFINEAVPLDRAIVTPAEPHFILDAYFAEKWARVMPVFGVPGLGKL